MMSRISTTSQTAACLGHAGLFLDPIFDEPEYTLDPYLRHRAETLAAQADAWCVSCPMMDQCLYDAVIRHDVAGFVAGTTPVQRDEMRARLRWTVEGESFDLYAGVSSGRQVDHDEITRLRHEYPSHTLEDIAERVGCSLSTVKRHLRREREQSAMLRLPVRPVLKPVPPSLEQVYAARRDVVAGVIEDRSAVAQAA